MVNFHLRTSIRQRGCHPKMMLRWRHRKYCSNNRFVWIRIDVVDFMRLNSVFIFHFNLADIFCSNKKTNVIWNVANFPARCRVQKTSKLPKNLSKMIQNRSRVPRSCVLKKVRLRFPPVLGLGPLQSVASSNSSLITSHLNHRIWILH